MGNVFYVFDLEYQLVFICFDGVLEEYCVGDGNFIGLVY